LDETSLDHKKIPSKSYDFENEDMVINEATTSMEENGVVTSLTISTGPSWVPRTNSVEQARQHSSESDKTSYKRHIPARNEVWCMLK
jgi:hypothetical protein